MSTMYVLARIGPLPSMASLMQHSWTVYLVPRYFFKVTEFIIALLLYLQYRDAMNKVYMYINNMGTSSVYGYSVELDIGPFDIDETLNLKKT